MISYSVEAVIFYIVFLDAIITNLIAWFFSKWYEKKKAWHKILPITKTWAVWYLILVLWIGYALYRLNVLRW